VANVRAPPYGAKGDGNTDDTAAIQRAIDERDMVFLPKGEYTLSRPLVLKPQTRLFGVSNLLSVLSPARSPAFQEVDRPAPLIDTVDDLRATTMLAFVELRVPVTNPAVYALRWRAGRNSVVRDIHLLRTFWVPEAPPALHPLVRIEGSGGGRWYDLHHGLWWSQSPDYRHLLVDGTREPLSFYMLNSEHTRSNAGIEFRGARNISVYSLKAEGLFTTLWMHGCRDVRVFGFGGVSVPRPNWPVIRIEDSSDFLLANINPELPSWAANARFWAPSFLPSDPEKWILISDTEPKSGVNVKLRGVEQVALYRRGDPQRDNF
jgi:hypothetical protein